MSETHNEKEGYRNDPLMRYEFLKGLSPDARAAFEDELQKEMRIVGIKIADDGTVSFQHTDMPEAGLGIVPTPMGVARAMSTIVKKMTDGNVVLPDFALPAGRNAKELRGEYEAIANAALAGVGNLLRSKIAMALEKKEMNEVPQYLSMVAVPPSATSSVELLINGQKATIDGKTGTLTMYLNEHERYVIEPGFSMQEIRLRHGQGVVYGRENGTAKLRISRNVQGGSIQAVPSKLLGCDIKLAQS